MPGRPAIFLDRDGVLNDVVWRDGKPASPRSADELHVADGAAQAVADFRAAGYLAFVVTNQPDVRRGKMSAEALDAIHAALIQRVPVDEVRACLHDNADQCDCRKPKAGMLLDLAARWDVDLTRSWMVGDMDRDIGLRTCGGGANRPAGTTVQQPGRCGCAGARSSPGCGLDSPFDTGPAGAGLSGLSSCSSIISSPLPKRPWPPSTATL